jgi:hypothetical protein
VIGIRIRHNARPGVFTESPAVKQLRYAGSLALNETAKIVARATERRIDEAFDKPTPFTQRSTAILYANRANLKASVIIKDAQARYLTIQEVGGKRTPQRRAIVVPVNARLNAYGNLSRKQVQRLLLRSDTFSGEVGGVGGIWQRMKGNKLKLLIAYKPETRYEPRFAFVETALATARREFPSQYRAAIARALATAR